MRIDRLTVKNFKGFVEQTFDFHQKFTLLVGENGSGKTSILDALAVAMGIWHVAAPGSGWRSILPEEIRLEPQVAGDRIMFQPCLPSEVTAKGAVGGEGSISWTRMIRVGGTKTTNAKAREAEEEIRRWVFGKDSPYVTLPVLAYYGAGRAWLPSNKQPSFKPSVSRPMRMSAYHNCLNARIRETDLNEWFLYETAASNEIGKERPGLTAVKEAIKSCIPSADGVRYDGDLKQVVLSITGMEQPFYNLSAGQRMMLALVADIAIKAVTLNSHWLHPGMSEGFPAVVLRNTPGIVLIDELDVHLHPRWQRRVATDLKNTFPQLQFICTSHSPQVIGELRPEEIRILDDNKAYQPRSSFGMNSDRILEELLQAKARNESTETMLQTLFNLIDEENLDAAGKMLSEVESKLGQSDPEVTRARSLIAFLENKP